MKTIYILTDQAYDPLMENPEAWLQTVRLEWFAGWSTSGGATGPLYRTRSGTYQVLPPAWEEIDVKVFADMMGATTTRVEMADEEADAVIARLDSNSTDPLVA